MGQDSTTSQEDWERLATNLRVERELGALLERLSDLRPVVFKGGTLTRLIYGDLRQRASADNDIWIKEPDCSEALERLLSDGFAPLVGLDPRRALKRDKKVALWPGGDLDAVSVDLHAVPFYDEIFQFEEEDLERHLMPIELHGAQTLTFDRPLSFVQMVSHYLQHRLERHHLREIGAAWDAWELDENELRALARRSCSEEALEHAVGLATALGWTKRPPLARLSSRARLIGKFDTASMDEAPPSRGRVLSILLAAPERLPRAVLRGVLLQPDELEMRFGSGSRLELTARRVVDLLTRG